MPQSWHSIKVGSFSLFPSSHSWNPVNIASPFSSKKKEERKKKTPLRNSFWHCSLGGADTQVWFHSQMMKLLDCASWDPTPFGKDSCQKIRRSISSQRSTLFVTSCLDNCNAHDLDLPQGAVRWQPMTQTWQHALSLGQPEASPAHPGRRSALADVLHQVQFTIWTLN